jgi:hypothetical protein
MREWWSRAHFLLVDVIFWQRRTRQGNLFRPLIAATTPGNALDGPFNDSLGYS